MYIFPIIFFIALASWFFFIGRGSSSRSGIDVFNKYDDFNEDDELITSFPEKITYKWISEFTGDCMIPKRVYQGDSRNIIVNIRKRYKETDWKIYSSIDDQIGFMKDDKGFTIFIPTFFDKDYLLEFELISAGIIIQGEARQNQSLANDVLSFQWNCYFPNSGQHEFLIMLRLNSIANNLEIGSMANTIKVVKIFDLTQRQVWVIASIAAALSGIFSILEILHNLGLL